VAVEAKADVEASARQQTTTAGTKDFMANPNFMVVAPNSKRLKIEVAAVRPEVKQDQLRAESGTVNRLDDLYPQLPSHLPPSAENGHQPFVFTQRF